ncbi:hypothetical protein NNG64_19035 [Bacillus siamensis]|uniref:Uncharacterized protein n=1 Tax=Bacillus siamensis TaxID=659243 RepID=A0AAI8HK50_9BACI|nr:MULTISPECIES: hypothetical protein [Bacillus]AME06924.1 hypothetical protein AUL54_11615 [Bacillus sp. SDLI1]AUJ75502.1 hypothetical protein CWD84_01030 [Bacillus siamensis]UUA84121.1 hypothetical protein NNG64_19035 [Bacillus siamensis]
MSELVFTRINTKINTSGPIILSMNAAELIVLAQEKRKDKYINRIFIFRNRDGYLRHRYQIETSKKITGVQKSGDLFLFIIHMDYKDGMVHEEPNIYVWHPIKGFCHSFYGGRYIRSMTVDSANHLWLGYDEAGIFSCLDDDISSKGVTRFPFTDGTWKSRCESFCTYPHLIDHFYGAYAEKNALYLHYHTLGEDYIRKVDLQGETLSFQKADFDFSAQFKIDSSYYFLIRNEASCRIDKALKFHNMTKQAGQYQLTDKVSRKALRFTQVTAYQDKAAGIDESNRLYLLS